ncbi:hypothetical protein EXW83_26535 [Klebsiella pneumoniae]|nr:hypothetical protein [Klebsiella pneumoniae]MDO8019217.1 hypothetical protein [Klebsiella pneumoniae]
MLDMRLGNSGDIPFIMNLVRDGITSGAFFYAEGNGLETVRSGGVSGNPRKFRHSALWNFLGGWSAA